MTHENDPADARYRRFLSRVTVPLVPRLRPGSIGLDYGCGPGPTLSVMLREHGFEVRDYDPYFATDEAPLRSTYDFITCTETAEHFYQPADEFRRLDGLLREGGCLAVMTEMLDVGQDLTAWWYVRDPTHVSFYGEDTMAWLARWRGWQVHRPSRNVTLFVKADNDRTSAGEASWTENRS